MGQICRNKLDIKLVKKDKNLGHEVVIKQSFHILFVLFKQAKVKNFFFYKIDWPTINIHYYFQWI